MKEYLVSFQHGELLKQIGFNDLCDWHYMKFGNKWELIQNDYPDNFNKGGKPSMFSVPTFEQALDFLDKKKGY